MKTRWIREFYTACGSQDTVLYQRSSHRYLRAYTNILKPACMVTYRARTGHDTTRVQHVQISRFLSEKPRTMCVHIDRGCRSVKIQSPARLNVSNIVGCISSKSVPMRPTTETSRTVDAQEISMISLDLVAASVLSWSTHCPAIKSLNVHAQLVTGRIERDLRRDTIVPRTDVTHTHSKKARMMFTCIRFTHKYFLCNFPFSSSFSNTRITHEQITGSLYSLINRAVYYVRKG